MKSGRADIIYCCPAVPDLPDIAHDKIFSAMHNVPGPAKMVELSVRASELVRIHLGEYMDRDALDRIRFESLILPFMYEARRVGDARGRVREKSMVAGLFPGTE